MYTYPGIKHKQQANCKRFLATSFRSKIELSSDHYARNEEEKTLQVNSNGDLPLRIKNIF
jgi:hypothetical protein